jgi:multidrug resistance efflux pump
MTWANRFKMFFGLLMVVAIVAALTIVFSQRKGETTSATASIQAVEYPVGTDYPGSVIAQSVEAGDEVAIGDPIATIQSNTLLEQLGNGATIASTGTYDVFPDGTLTIKSTVNGIVDEVLVQQGGYAAGGSTVARLSATDPLHVTAEYVLDPKDFARVEEGAFVTLELPNTETIAGTVDSFEVETVDGQARAIVTISSTELTYGGHGGLVAPGTPISAEMKLRNDDVLARLVGSVRDFASDLKDAILR